MIKFARKSGYCFDPAEVRMAKRFRLRGWYFFTKIVYYTTWVQNHYFSKYQIKVTLNLVRYLLSSPAAYYFPYWRTLTAVIAAAYLLFLPLIYCCPPSPKWLHIKGKSSKVQKVIRIFARKTKVEINESILENLEYDRIGLAIGE